MKLFIYLVSCLLLFNSCNHSNYYGYVYDFDNKKPLKGVKVYDVHNKTKGITNQKGYFELNKVKNTSGILIFQKINYHSDTIHSISIQNGEVMKEKFKGEIIYLFNEHSTFRDSILKANNIK